MHDRRQFLKTGLAGAGLLAVSPRLSLEDVAAPVTATARAATDRVLLGGTGIRASLLAQGTGYNGFGHASDMTRMGQATFTRLVRHSFDEGVNFLDMADSYGSHPFVREAFRGVPRDRLVMLTKLWPRKESWNTPSGGARVEVDRFRRELGTEMLDVCLVHCVQSDDWLEDYARVRDDLSALKDEGAIRAVGVSCHDFGALERAAAHPWVDVIFARVNHRGGGAFSCDASPGELAETLALARRNGKAVVGMKIFGAGKLVAAEDKDASLRFVLGNRLVDAMTIGMKTPDQVDDTTRRISAALAA
jgi:aryl-alcohol dehydrogenase-like predicted oxidoreductase